ncbi:GroES-like protein [Daedaleopsis nitida]|nr:GroES-like protein [Daedaleopsis nitida]
MPPVTQKVLVVPEPMTPWKLVPDWPVPKPGPKEVLVKVVAAAINLVDSRLQFFAPPAIKDYPWIGGVDGAGVVEEVGPDVTNVVKGDKVLFPGGFAQAHSFMQYTIAAADSLAKIPDNVSMDEAASIPVGLSTVTTGIWSHHPQAQSVDFPAPWEEGGTTKFAGQPALVVGGSSSVGQYAIQLAKLQGFSPIIATSSLKHTEYLKSLGATHVLDRSLPAEAIHAELAQLTAGKPLMYAYAAIANEDTQHLAYDALAPGGSLVLSNPWNVELLQTKVDRDSAAGLVPPKKVARPFGSLVIPANKAMGEELYKRVTEWLRTGVLVPNRVEVIPGGLLGVLEGCARMRENKVSGVKLIVHPQDTA